MIMILMVILASVLTFAYAYLNRSIKNNAEQQAYFTARTVAELLEKQMTDGNLLYEQLKSTGSASVTQFNLPEGMGNCTAELKMEKNTITIQTDAKFGTRQKKLTATLEQKEVQSGGGGGSAADTVVWPDPAPSELVPLSPDSTIGNSTGKKEQYYVVEKGAIGDGSYGYITAQGEQNLFIFVRAGATFRISNILAWNKGEFNRPNVFIIMEDGAKMIVNPIIANFNAYIYAPNASVQFSEIAVSFSGYIYTNDLKVGQLFPSQYVKPKHKRYEPDGIDQTTGIGKPEGGSGGTKLVWKIVRYDKD